MEEDSESVHVPACGRTSILWEELEINILVRMKQNSNIKAIFKEINLVDSWTHWQRKGGYNKKLFP